MTPSFIGLMATMLPGVRPSISLASLPTASIRPVTLLMATIEGSLTTMPLPRAYTQVLAVPRSMARSLENSENSERSVNEAPHWTGGHARALRFRRLTGGAAVTAGDVDAVLPGALHTIHRRVSRLKKTF